MNIQLTTAGIALLEANTGPVVVTSYKLGSAFNYVPNVGDTNIHGTVVHTGVPSAPVPADGNTTLYSIFLGFELGPFDFGEVGLFVGSTLFALGASNVLLHKAPSSDEANDNSMRLDMYVQSQGSGYDTWLTPGISNNQFMMAVLQSPDLLPPAKDAVPNAYVLQSISSVSLEASQAYSDRGGVWAFSEYSHIGVSTVTAATSVSVTFARADHDPEMTPAYLGQTIMQFMSGATRGICRNIKNIVLSGVNATINLETPLAIVPVVGTSIAIYSREAQAGSTVPPFILSPATTDALGGVIVGTGLTVSPEGLLSTIPPTPYTLPMASPTVLGGVKVGSGLAIDGAGVLSATATGGVPVVPVVTVTTTSANPGAGTANGTYFRMDTVTAGAAAALVLPTDATHNFDIGTSFSVRCIGTNAVTVSGAGVTVTPPVGYLAQGRDNGSVFAVVKVAANTWEVTGDLLAA